MSILLFVFIIMPIAEMAVLIQVGGMIGVFNTIGFVLLTAVAGAWLLRQQGLATLLKANQRLNSGELPAKEVAEGLILAVGGVRELGRNVYIRTAATGLIIFDLGGGPAHRIADRA